SPSWAFGSGDFTIDLWVNFVAINQVNAFVANDEGSGPLNKWVFQQHNGQLQFHINSPSIGNPGIDIGSTPFAPQPGEWHHVAVTKNGTTYTFYVDGVAGSPVANTMAVPDANAPLTIGQAENNFFLNGQLDEIEIFNRSLTASEIQAIVNAGSAGKCRTCTPPPPSMTAWYPGDGNANDIQGGNNGTLENGTTFAPGKVGQALSFDGVDDQVVVPPNANQNGGSQITIDAWVN